MAYLIGTDEAGYGPNLGPLVISATVWQVPDGVRGDDLYRLVGPCVAAPSGRVARNRSAAVLVGDSKLLYHPGHPAVGLRHLERGVLAALALLERRPTTWRAVWDSLVSSEWRVVRGDGRGVSDKCSMRRLAPHPSPLSTLPWYAHYDAPIPLDADPAETESLARTLREGFAAAGVRLVEVRSRAVFPEQFNRLVELYGSKGAALSHTTLELVADLVGPCAKGPISVGCDKHGGRNRYHELLADHFPERLIEVCGESRARSVYRFGPAERRVEVRFQTKAESQLPTALASMASKYLRELAMRALNDFWRRHVDGLRPTAGYPQDAKRFKAEIAAAQAELGIDDRVLWRTR